jgi:hypothetical protein
VKTNDDIEDQVQWEQQIKERDIFEQSNIFDAIMWGMKVSVKQHKQLETGTENDGH